MGAVFEVEHRQIGARYALKTVLAAPNTPGFALQHERFRREAELNARLDHPGILRVHSAVLDQDPPYLVIDLLRGGSLGERIDSQGEIPIEEGAPLALALARALRHAHQAGILHRDLKPENIMFDEFGAPRLVDFGLALEVGRESRLTQSGTAVGTPLTMAPEQIRGERDETSATDVYGLAATIYWALSGDAPLGSEFEGLQHLITAILTRPVRPLRELRPEVPRELSKLLQASLAKEPEERPTLERWIEVLELLQHLSASGSALERFVARTSAAQRLVVLALAAIVILGSLLAVTLTLLPEVETPTPSPTSTPVPAPARDWRTAIRAGAREEACRGLLTGNEALRPEDAALAGEVLAAGAIPADLVSSLEGFALRLEGLESEERGALWTLACLGSGELELARKHTRRNTAARQLITLESSRARIDREHVLPRLTEISFQGSLTPAQRAFSSLKGSIDLWGPKRLRRLPPLDRALATLVTDRLLWTMSRLGFILLQAARVHGTGGQTVQTGIQILQQLPEGPGLGRIALRLFVASDQTSGNYPEHFSIYLRAKAYEAELLADPGGRALYGTLAVRYEADPEEALRLGLLAYDQVRNLAELSRHSHWLAPRVVSRRIEFEWLRGEPPAPSEGLKSALAVVNDEIKGRRSGIYPALVAWHLSRREFGRARAVLEEAEQRQENDPDYHEAVRLARSELELAENPAGAAEAVLARHTPPRGLFLEEFGLRAHAKVLAGLDPAQDLAELKRRRRQGWRRVGFAWHAFDLPALLDGRVWWPGVPR